ncbi:unnamed protein product, partial [Effrenium voratum]
EDVGRNQVLQKLRRMSATARAEAVESRLPSEHQDFFEGQLAAPHTAAGEARRGGRAAVESLQWLGAAWASRLAAWRAARLWRTRLAEDFERWCLFHSWGMCAGCGMMAPRDLTEHTLTQDQKVTQAAGIQSGLCKCRARLLARAPSAALPLLPSAPLGLP